MLEAGVLNTLLIRMDLPYATQLRCTRPPDIELEGEEYPWDTMLLITSLLWSLVVSVLPPRKRPENLPPLQQCAMWYYLSITIPFAPFFGAHAISSVSLIDDSVIGHETSAFRRSAGA